MPYDYILDLNTICTVRKYTLFSMYTILPNTLGVTWQGMIFIFNILMNPLQYATPPLPNVVWLSHTLFKYTTIKC